VLLLPVRSVDLRWTNRSAVIEAQNSRKVIDQFSEAQKMSPEDPLFKDYDFSPKGGGMLIRKMHEGDRISKTLGNARGMLMWAHGANVVGKSVHCYAG
jgi:hypothetical protein